MTANEHGDQHFLLISVTSYEHAPKISLKKVQTYFQVIDFKVKEEITGF